MDMDLTNSNIEMMTKWKQILVDVVINDNLLCTITPKHTPTGFYLLCNLWCLFKIQTSHNRCADSVYKSSIGNSLECNCSVEK